MPEYEIVAGVLEAEGDQYREPADGTVALDADRAEWFDEHTAVSLHRASSEESESDPGREVAEPPEGATPEPDPDPGVPDQLQGLPGIGVERAAVLASEGYETVADVADAEPDALVDDVGGIGDEGASEVVAAAQEQVE